MAGYFWCLGAVARQRILAVFCFQRVYMDGSIRGLSRDILIQGVPGDTLNVMAVLGDLADEHTWATIRIPLI